MKLKQKVNTQEPLCAEARMDDGIDSKTLAKRDQHAHKDRKVHQVCRQVERALSFVLADMGDALLQSLFVDKVEPAPDSSHLQVTIASYPRAEGVEIDIEAVLAALKGAEGQLQAAVSAAVNRKKTPQLSFQYRL